MDRTLIIGAGMAGAATAYFLSERGVPVVLLERETMPGTHSTGRNAAILRTLTGEASVQAMAQESFAFYMNPPRGFAPRELVSKVGLFLAAMAGHEQVLKSWLDLGHDSPMELVKPEAVYSRIPVLADGIDMAVYCREEGTLDVNTILQAFIEGARRNGAEVRYRSQVCALEVRDGRVAGVATGDGFLPGNRVAVAAGGWAAWDPFRRDFPLPLEPFRRHLLVTEPLDAVDPQWPVLWIAGQDFYFRPESGGLLISACDTAPVAPEQGEIVDPSVAELIAEKTSRWLPSLAGAGVARMWAGMRTFAPDQHFVIGPDPRAEGLFWVAGLGGHGITCAPAAGRLAAGWIADGQSQHPHAAVFLPARLLAPGPSAHRA